MEDRGYCPDMLDPINRRDVNTIVKYSSNWGYCQEICAEDEDAADRLQETTQDILPIKDCTKFNNSRLNYRKEVSDFVLPGKSLQFAIVTINIELIRLNFVLDLK